MKIRKKTARTELNAFRGVSGETNGSSGVAALARPGRHLSSPNHRSRESDGEDNCSDWSHCKEFVC